MWNLTFDKTWCGMPAGPSKTKRTCTLLEGTRRWTYSALRYFLTLVLDQHKELLNSKLAKNANLAEISGIQSQLY